jgi:hypothetical protein
MLAKRVLFTSGEHKRLLDEGWQETGWLKSIDSLGWFETILTKEAEE